MKISYIVLYLNDTTKAMEFWVNKMGYSIKSQNNIGTNVIYKVGKEGNFTNFELVPLKLMENNPHNINLGIPSIAFEVDDLETEHNKLSNLNIKVSEIIEHQGILCFTLFDTEDNAFAVIES